jgi:hypothetical protein
MICGYQANGLRRLYAGGAKTYRYLGACSCKLRLRRDEPDGRLIRILGHRRLYAGGAMIRRYQGEGSPFLLLP